MKYILNTGKYCLLLIICSLFLIQGCQKNKPNTVLQYVKNSQLTFYNKMQRDVVKEAMYDIMTLDKADLKERRYKDSTGVENAWDVRRVIQTYFVPRKPGLTLGDDFYSEVKADSVMIEMGRLYMVY
jgi:hypothetical protein